MRVVVSVAGAFHAFHLAEQLHRHGMLERLVTTWPAGHVTKRLGGRLPRRLVRTTGLHAPMVLLARAGFTSPWIGAGVRRGHELMSALTVHRGLDLWVGWSGSSLAGLKRARQLGVTPIVVRGSSHIAYQYRVLSEEYQRYGHTFPANARLLAQELEEYETAEYVQTNSSFAARTMIAEGIPESRILHTPTGVDLSEFRPVPKEDDVFRVVFAGQLGVRKGARYLLQAFHELNLPGAELWHLGSVEDAVRPELKRFDHPGIRLLGHKPMRELHRYYSQCSVFVHPSLEEGLSVVQAQAMACGLPLICTTNTGGDDLMSADGREGFVVPIRDVETLKERLLWLYENPDARRDMGQAARDRVTRGFTWNDYGDRIAGLYRSISANRTHSATGT